MSCEASEAGSSPGAWRAEELCVLRQLAAQGVKASRIASTLRRTEASVRGKAFGCGIRLTSERSPNPVTLRRLSFAEG
jgi:hypothetical protein